MTEPATVGSSVGARKKPGLSSTHPLEIEAIWSRICMHLTTNEWLRMARTCKASWYAQLPQVVLTEDTPVAAYSFVLERCQAASSIFVAVEGIDASIALTDTLRSYSKLRSAKQLTVRAGRGCSIDRLLGYLFYEACPNLQVVSMESCFVQKGWHTRPSIRHLDLETGIAALPKCTDWQAFPQLETLRLCAWKAREYPIDTIDLDISGAPTLGRLQIENWSPKSIKVAAGCRVYAVWQPPATAKIATKMSLHSWLQSRCWKAPGTNLAALQIEHLVPHDRPQFSAIGAILECQHKLETLTITVAYLGHPDSLLNMLVPYFKGMKTPLKVDITTRVECFPQIPVDYTLCLCKTLLVVPDGKGRSVLKLASGELYSDVSEGYSARCAEVWPLFMQEQLAI